MKHLDSIDDLLTIQRKAFELALAQMGLRYWEYDIPTHRLYRSALVQNEVGYSAYKDNVPESYVEEKIIHPDYAQAYLDFYHNIQRGNNDRLVFQSLYADGHFGWLDISYSVVFDRNGKPYKAIGVGGDVTEQKNKEKEYQYTKLLHSLSDMNDSNLIAKGQHNLSKNKTLYYYARKEGAVRLQEGGNYDFAVERLASSAIFEEDCAKLRKIFDRNTMLNNFKDGQQEGEIEYKRYMPDGSSIWTNTKYALSEEPETGDIIAFLYSYNTTERILEKHIIERFNAVEYDIIGMVDLNSHVFSIKSQDDISKETIFHVLGNYEEIISSRIHSLISENKQKKATRHFSLENISQNLTQKDAYYFAYSIEDSSGKMLRKKAMFSYLDDTRTTLLFCRSDVTDLYEQEQDQLKQTEEALAAAEKASNAKTEFLSNMSHDMRTPMNGILGLAALMRDKTDLNEIRKDLEQIELSGHYLLSLINDTLDMNKIESGKLTIYPKPIDGALIYQNIITHASLMAVDKGVHLITNFPDIPPENWISVLADPSRLEQILMNVVSNAIKYTPKGGTVTLEMKNLSITEDYVTDQYIIRDTGIGMSESFIPHLFEPFSQEGRINTERQNGTGLGMSIVKQLVKLMDGDIQVKSTLNAGTEVTIVLRYPINKENTIKKTDGPIDLSILKGTHILLCEDHPLNRQIASRLLEKQGITVTCAENGLSGIQIFKQSGPNDFQAILMDIRMPVMDGLKATEVIRSLPTVYAKTIPIIALTANAFDDDVKKCLDVGMNAHVAKPFEPETLFQTIANLIKKD